MILGIGIDLVEVKRIRASLEKYGDHFLERILGAEEIAYCLKFRQPALQVAARFAAKEAVAKAFGTGISAELGWQDIEVRHLDTGQPVLHLQGAGLRLMEKRKVARIHLSLSHTADYACASVLLEGHEEGKAEDENGPAKSEPETMAR